MANLRISQLPAATTLASADIVPFSSISATETRKITAQNLGLVLTQLGLSVGSTAPSSPYNGQVWVDTATNPPLVKVWNGVTFTIVSFQPGASIITNPSGTAPSSPILGQLWQDTSQTPDELKMWDGANWVRPDPDGITQAFADARYLQIATAASTYLALSGGTLTGNLTLVGAPTTNNMASTKKYVDDQIAAIPASDGVPAGTVIWTARNTAPTGYLKANGAAVSRTTYADLFSAIGTFYGSGNGSTTFNLPDLRGEFVRGWDDGRGVDSGRAFGSAQAQSYQSHQHTGSTNGAGAHNHTGSTDSAGSHNHTVPATYDSGTDAFAETGNRFGVDANIPTSSAGDHAHSFTTNGVGDHAHSFTTNASGGTETRPRNVALLACIKT
jgi:microcystin-dependent protein